MKHKATEWKYLRELQFDPALNKSGFAFWTDKLRVVSLMTIMVVVGGVISLMSLPLESQPEVVLGIGAVTTTMPGASPETMEDLVTKKLEKEISKIKWIDKMTSTSRNSLSSIVVQFKAWEDVKNVIRELKDSVDTAKKDIPTDATDPIVKEISISDSPFWTFTVAGNYDWFKLRKYATTIKDEFEWMDGVSEARISWGSEEEFEVAYDSKKLEQLWITPTDWDNALKSNNISFPIWNINIDNYKHILSVDTRYYGIWEIEEIIVSKSWETGIIKIKDIAKVSLVAKKRTSLARTSVGWKKSEEAITVSVIKKSGWSIIDLYESGLKKIENLKWKGIPADITIQTTYSMADRIKLDIDGLTHDFMITIFLVLAVLFTFLGLKLSLVPTITIPIVFLFTFIFMKAFGLTLNFLSLFALVLSLWLLVDDAVLIVEAYHKYQGTGRFTNREAILLVLRDYKWVDTSTTLVIVCFFASMMFMTGIIGKFLFSLPFVITIVLLGSLLSSLTIVPAAILLISGKDCKKWVNWEKDCLEKMWFFTRIFNKILNTKPLLSLNPLINLYEKWLKYVLFTKKRMIVFLVSIFLLFFIALSLPITGLLKSEFFPATDEDLIGIDIEWEAGQRLEITSLQASKIEKILEWEKEIESYSTLIWWQTMFGNSALGWGGASSDHLAGITINLLKKEYWRQEKSWDIATRLREKTKNIKIPGVKITVKEAKSGPPTGADLEIQVSGEDFTTLDKILADLKPIMSSLPGAVNISTSRQAVPFEYLIEFDNNKLALNSLTVPQVASFLREAVDGIETTKIFRWSDEIVVRTRIAQNEVETMDQIKNLKIKNNKWQLVFLGDVINEKLNKTVSSISRIDQKRVVSIMAGADKSTNSTQLLADFNAEIAKRWYELPKWYEFIIGWTNEENAKSIQSLMIAMLFGLVWVLMIMVLQFNSYKEAFISVIPIPLALIWVFIGMTLTGQSLSFPTLIWFVALFWMVSNHSIYLIDKINLNRNAWVEFEDSIRDACVTRFEPVLLTSLTTIMWFVPLAFTTSVWASLAQALVFGLMTAGILKMFVVPVCYKLIVRK